MTGARIPESVWVLTTIIGYYMLVVHIFLILIVAEIGMLTTFAVHTLIQNGLFLV